MTGNLKINSDTCSSGNRSADQTGQASELPLSSALLSLTEVLKSPALVESEREQKGASLLQSASLIASPPSPPTPDTPTQVSTPAPKESIKSNQAAYIAKKVMYYAVYAFLALFNFAMTCTVTGIPKLYSHIFNAEFKNEINTAKLKAFAEALDQPLRLHPPGETTISAPIRNLSAESLFSSCNRHYQLEQGSGERRKTLEVADFISNVLKIKQLIEKSEQSNFTREDAESIRNLINQAMGTNVYQALIHLQIPAINFLQTLAYKDISTDGEEALINYGKKVTGGLEDTDFSFEDLAVHLDRHAGATFAFKMNGPISKGLWYLAHPLNTWDKVHNRLFPDEFNAHKDNPNFRGFDFVDPSNKRLPFYYGPTPTDRLFRNGVLPYMQKTGAFEIRGSHQTTTLRSENVGIESVREARQRYQDQLKFYNLSFDTKAMAMGEEFDFEGPADFMLKFTKFAKSDHGLDSPASSIIEVDGQAYRKTHSNHKMDNGHSFYVEDMPEERFLQAFATTETIFTELSEDNEFWKKHIEAPEGRQRLGRMMQLGTHAVLSMDLIYRAMNPETADEQLEEILAASRVSGACKQDIDRGIVENIATRLFFRLLSNDNPLTADEAHSIIGAVIGRAEMVEGRLIMWDRYEVLSDLLHFIGDKRRMESLAEILKEHLQLTQDSGDSDQVLGS